MSAIDAALSTSTGSPTKATSPPTPADAARARVADGEPILLPDGKRIYPPRLHGQPIDELACALLDIDNPAESTFLRLIGPPGSGKSPARPRDRLPALAQPRPRRDRPARRPVLRVRRDQRRPVQRRVPVPPRVRPRRRRRRHRPARRLGVRAGDARGVGGDDRRGQHDPRRRAAVASTRASTAASASTCRRPGETVIARPGFACLLAYNPGLVGADRHPRRVALAVPGDARGHEQLAGARRARRPRAARRRGDARSTASGSPARTGSDVDAAVPRHRSARRG